MGKENNEDDKFFVSIEVDENSMLKELVNLRKIVAEMDRSISKLYFSIQGKQEAQDKEKSYHEDSQF